MTIGVFYGSTTGNTQEAAEAIAERLGATLTNVADATPEALEACDVLVLGSSTWGLGDLQDDWAAFLPKIDASKLTGKKVALFGCGDQSAFGDTYGNALAHLRDALAPGGVTFIGAWPAEGYDGTGDAREGDHFIGLMLDENNQSDQTGPRIDAWVAQIKGEMA